MTPEQRALIATLLACLVGVIVTLLVLFLYALGAL